LGVSGGPGVLDTGMVFRGKKWMMNGQRERILLLAMGTGVSKWARDD